MSNKCIIDYDDLKILGELAIGSGLFRAYDNSLIDKVEQALDNPVPDNEWRTSLFDYTRPPKENIVWVSNGEDVVLARNCKYDLFFEDVDDCIMRYKDWPFWMKLEPIEGVGVAHRDVCLRQANLIFSSKRPQPPQGDL